VLPFAEIRRSSRPNSDDKGDFPAGQSINALYIFATAFPSWTLIGADGYCHNIKPFVMEIFLLALLATNQSY